MPSVREFALPDLGEGLTDAEIVRWLVKVGDAVAVDQPVVEVETAKAAVEVPCPFSGVVSTLFAAEGERLAVGKPMIAVTDDTGSGNVLVGYGTSEPPRRERATTNGPVPVSSPVVRRLARDNGVDLSTVLGSGPHGVIGRSDVLRAIDDRSTSVPLRGRSAAAAEKFVRSRREIPDATCWVDADATALVDAKARIADVGLLALLARICVAALDAYPQFNATVDTERGEVRHNRSVHLGVAAQSEQGLVVPVVRDADKLTTVRLAAALRALTTTARQGKLTPRELTGSTFTLNNYGVFGVDGSTPILNYPEAAMLGVGRIVDKPWVRDGALLVRKVVQLSFTFDHRVCDGAQAGGFLRYVADRVEHPIRLLGDL
jgi:pyruvate dehydrogenase E2 component (dihydrolipoamide acetyltransferase)